MLLIKNCPVFGLHYRVWKTFIPDVQITCSQYMFTGRGWPRIRGYIELVKAHTPGRRKSWTALYQL